MGTQIVYGRLSRFSFYIASGWKPALSRQSSSLSPRTQIGAQWLVSSVVCGPHRRLPQMRVACSMSRKPFHQQTTTGQCRFLASFCSRGDPFITCARTAFASLQADRRPPDSPCPLGRLATVSDPAQLAESGTLRNGGSSDGNYALARTEYRNQGASNDPSTTCALASQLV